MTSKWPTDPTDPDALRAFVIEHTRLLPVPHVPSIQLHLADEAIELWRKTESEIDALGLPPPFWAFAWAGGQAVARYILDTPEHVRGKSVIDFAAGSGVAAIACLQAGAVQVVASEVDPFAIAAMQVNARANGVRFLVTSDDLIACEPPDCDVLIAGDVCYEQPMADEVVAWLERAASRGSDVLIGDPGRSYLPKEKLVKAATYQVPVTRALEDADIKTTTVWRFRSS